MDTSDNTLTIMRGDGGYTEVGILADVWEAGGRLFFASKETIDDDKTDGRSLVTHSWGDDKVVDYVENGVEYKLYQCDFPGSTTDNIASGGAESRDLLGEFQWVLPGQDPLTLPGPSEPRIPVVIVFDVKRGTTS